jgi:hypothetical protein
MEVIKLKIKYVLLVIKSWLRPAWITLATTLSPWYWPLFYACVKQFKYDFGCSAFSKEGISRLKKVGEWDEQGRFMRQWALDTGMQLSPIYLKEL